MIPMLLVSLLINFIICLWYYKPYNKVKNHSGTSTLTAMERKLDTKETLEVTKGYKDFEIFPSAVETLIGETALGVITNTTMEHLLDAETHHKLSNNIKILKYISKL